VVIGDEIVVRVRQIDTSNFAKGSMNEKSTDSFNRLHELPQRLRWKAVTSKSMLRYFATRVLNTANQKVRNRLFDMLGQAVGADFAYVNRGHERYLVNCRDRVISKIVFATGEFEFNKFETALRLLRLHTSIANVDVLVDVGANIGTVCIPAVARGLVRAAVGIEPHPVNCKLLRANIALNSVDARVIVHECAVGASDNETLTLELSDDNWGDHRIAVTNEDGNFGESTREKITIRSMRLDGLVTPQPDKHMLIWMDTQGYEGFVLRGGAALLAAGVPIVTEFWPYGMRRAGSYPLFREQLSTYRGFIDLNTADSGSEPALQPMGDLDRLHDTLDVNERSYTDLLVV
jgi:FkbM family methyltransferase